MDPYGNPMNGSDVHNEVVVIDGIVYNRTWNTVGSGNEGDEYQWGEGQSADCGSLIAAAKRDTCGTTRAREAVMISAPSCVANAPTVGKSSDLLRHRDATNA
jgi:hypothetical protein